MQALFVAAGYARDACHGMTGISHGTCPNLRRSMKALWGPGNGPSLQIASQQLQDRPAVVSVVRCLCMAYLTPAMSFQEGEAFLRLHAALWPAASPAGRHRGWHSAKQPLLQGEPAARIQCSASCVSERNVRLPGRAHCPCTIPTGYSCEHSDTIR